MPAAAEDLRRWAIAALLVVCAACARPAPPDIIVVSLDTLRRDQVGLHSSSGASLTPNIDALAGESVVFEDAWAQVPFTLPSHMSIFTGLYPDVHGVDRGASRLADAIPTLPELMRSAGYQTVGLVTNLYMKGEFGFARGFDLYERLPYDLVYAERVNRRTFELLDARGDDDRPLFLFLHYIDPHSDFFNVGQNRLPYYAPPEFLGDLGVSTDSHDFCDVEGNCATEFLLAADREDRALDPAIVSRIAALYGRGVAYLDREVGVLVDGLRRRSLWDGSLVLVTSDHGEEFREHGKFIHVQPYAENLAVPLLVKMPHAERGGSRVAATVETVDYLPTLLDAAGVAHPSPLQGRSLLPLLRGAPAPARPAFARDKVDHQRLALRFERWTLIHHLGTGRSELYDRLTDPGERDDLAGRQPERVAALRARLLEIVAANRELASAFAAAPAGADILTDEEAEKLRAIGYVE